MDVNLRLFNQRVMGPDDSLYKRNFEQDVTEEDETPNNGEHTANKTVTASALDILSLQAQGAIRIVSSVYPEIAEVGYTEVTIDGVNVGVDNKGDNGFVVTYATNKENNRILDKVRQIISAPRHPMLVGPNKADEIDYDPKVNGEIDEAVAQGATGDCWLISGVLALNSTEAGRQIIKDSIKVNSDGSITVTFKGLGVSYTISPEEIQKYDTDNIKDDAYSNGDNDMLVLELAVEKLRKDIENGVVKLSENLPDQYYIMSEYNEDNVKGTPGAAIYGGYEEQLIYFMTGVISEAKYANDDLSLFAPDEQHLTALAKGLEEDVVIDMLRNAYNSGNTCLTFGIYGGAGIEGSCHSAKLIDGRTLYFHFENIEGWGGHALTITDLTKDTVTFVDPNNPSTEYTMSWKEFAKFGIGCITSADLSGVAGEVPTTPSVNPDEPVIPDEPIVTPDTPVEPPVTPVDPPVAPMEPKVYTKNDFKGLPDSIINKYFEPFGFKADGTPEEWVVKKPYTNIDINGTAGLILDDGSSVIRDFSITTTMLDENGEPVKNTLQFFSQKSLDSLIGGKWWHTNLPTILKYFEFDSASGLYMLNDGMKLGDFKAEMLEREPSMMISYDPADPDFWTQAYHESLGRLYPSVFVEKYLSQGIIDRFFDCILNTQTNTRSYVLNAPYTSFELISNGDTERVYEFSYIKNGIKHITTVTIDETDGSYRIKESLEFVQSNGSNVDMNDMLNKIYDQMINRVNKFN